MNWYRRTQLEKEARILETIFGNEKFLKTLRTLLLTGTLGISAVLSAPWFSNLLKQTTNEVVAAQPNISPEQAAQEVAKKVKDKLQASQSASQPSTAVQSNQIAQYIERWEGSKNYAYRDTKGHWTLGVGLLIQYNDGRQPANIDDVLNKAGIPYTSQQLIQGSPEISKKPIYLTPEQVQNLQNISTQTYIDKARAILPNIDSLPEKAQLVAYDLTFNTGDIYSPIRNSLAAKQFDQAALNLINTKYYVQVGGGKTKPNWTTRSDYNASVLLSLAKQNNPQFDFNDWTKKTKEVLANRYKNHGFSKKDNDNKLLYAQALRGVDIVVQLAQSN